MIKKTSRMKSSALTVAGALLLVGLSAGTSQAAQITYEFKDSTARYVHGLLIKTSGGSNFCFTVGAGRSASLGGLPSGTQLWIAEYVGQTCTGNTLKSGNVPQANAERVVIDLAKF
ncbi:hypothetical protein RB628_00660 [Streptomyces sp. ADMS]|uniref:hypothetical protein n=1 Tax=Streptomyces sp. ADMS TaxID=3071415 RepID=UPI00296E9731|nr:hypothetical protein [Streptomyces sp. ADMS]MDW4903893.1 hypothetical protein [Streptomyces sp. ADMS]